MDFDSFTIWHAFQVCYPLSFGLVCAHISSRKNLNIGLWATSGAMFGPFSMLVLCFKTSLKTTVSKSVGNSSFIGWPMKVDLIFLVIYDAFLTCITAYLLVLVVQNPSLEILENYGYQRVVIDLLVLLTLVVGVIALLRKRRVSNAYFFLILFLYLINYYSGVVQILEPEDIELTNESIAANKFLILVIALRSVIWPLYVYVLLLKHNKISAHP